MVKGKEQVTCRRRSGPGAPQRQISLKVTDDRNQRGSGDCRVKGDSSSPAGAGWSGETSSQALGWVPSRTRLASSSRQPFPIGIVNSVP